MAARLTHEERRICELKTDIINFITEYFGKWRVPLPFYKISQKYGRVLRYYGSDIKTCMRELNQSQHVQMTLHEDGRYTVSPGLLPWDTSKWIAARPAKRD